MALHGFNLFKEEFTLKNTMIPFNIRMAFLISAFYEKRNVVMQMWF